LFFPVFFFNSSAISKDVGLLDKTALVSLFIDFMFLFYLQLFLLTKSMPILYNKRIFLIIVCYVQIFFNFML